MTVLLDADDVRGIVSHINEDHADALLACVHAFTPHRNASAARMTDIDARGIGVDCTVGGETLSEVIRFEHPLSSAEDVRPVLVAMTRAAREKLAGQAPSG